MKRFLITCFIFFHSFSVVSAQCCSGGVPLAGNMGLSTTNKGATQLLLTYDNNILNDLYAERESLGDKLRKRKTHSILFETNYGISERFTVSAMLSWVRQERDISTVIGSADFTKTEGIGDGFVLLKYKVIIPEGVPTFHWAIGAGPKIPFGKTTFIDNNGLALPADLQPGSGAWDLLLWSSFEKYNLFLPNFNFSTSIIYRLTGSNPDYFGSLKYRFGNEFSIMVQNQYNFFIQNRTLTALMGMRYRNQQTDFVNENEFPNSGGNFFFIIPGINYQMFNNFQAGISMHLPIYRQVGGTQLTTNQRLSINMMHTFQ